MIRSSTLLGLAERVFGLLAAPGLHAVVINGAAALDGPGGGPANEDGALLNIHTTLAPGGGIRGLLRAWPGPSGFVPAAHRRRG
jgi:hypothetical protein